MHVRDYLSLYLYAYNWSYVFYVDSWVRGKSREGGGFGSLLTAVSLYLE